MSRHLPSLNGLRAFEAAGRHRSFTAAGQELNVTQAAVSRMVRLLEGRLGFALFRAFDIAKPWPVSWADRRLTGGLGVMADDLLAGLLAAFVLQLSVRLFHLQS